MRLTRQQIGEIRASYERLVPLTSTMGDAFYTELFSRDPALRSMFREDLSEQGMKFMSTISVVVANLDAPAALTERIEQLARGHAPFGIAPRDYRTMEDALVATMARTLGPDFTARAEQAWRDAFRQLSEAMIARQDGTAPPDD